MNPSPTAAGRRARFGVLTLVMVLAVTASAVIAVLIGQRTAVRFDATDTGEHRLSPKTSQLLAHLTHDYEVVLAVNRAEVDPRALDRVRDVAGLIGHASPRVTITNMDTGSAAGLAQFDGLIARLAERDSAEITKQAEAVNGAIRALDEQASYFEGTLSPALKRLADAAAGAPEQGQTVREVLSNQASAVVAGARLIREAADSARAALQKPVAGAARLPATDQAAALLASSLRRLASDLGHLESQYIAPVAAAESMPTEAREGARPLAGELAARRDRVALLADAMSRLKPLDLQRIARALEASSAVLVVGPTDVGLNAIDPSALFPATEQIDLGAGVQADMRRRAEDLIVTALGLLEDPLKPIVMFVHGEGQRVLDNSGIFGSVVERFSLQGIGVAEWPVVLEHQPPSLSAIDPGGKRPVVFVVIATDASATVSTDPNLTGPARAEALGQVLDTLIEQGESVLLCLQPSTLPGYGQPDPMVSSLRLFGLQADTARPLLSEAAQPAGRLVQTDQVIRPAPADHLIWRAIQGLPTVFPWPIAVRTIDPAQGGRVSSATLFTVESQDAWAESQWLGYWQVPAAQRPAVIDPPAPDSTRDDTRGPWPVAVAATRSAPGLNSPQRLVVVGSKTWFFNFYTNAQTSVYGRVAPLYPGNSEFLEAAVQWLASKDDLIAQTTTARAVPLIAPLTDTQLSLWRWSTVAGLPLLALLCGLAWRILRG